MAARLDANADQLLRESTLETRLKDREYHLRFTSSDDAALLTAVTRVYRSELLSATMSRYHPNLRLPDSFWPLGSVSTPTLNPEQLGPRADSTVCRSFYVREPVHFSGMVRPWPQQQT